MNKTNLKDLIQECINEVRNENFIKQLEENLDKETQALEESNDNTALQSLCESLDMDAQSLQEAHESGESLVAEGLITEEEIDEGFFDTLGQFGKNTFNSVAGAWKKAKAQGDEAEAKRLEKRLKDLKSGSAGKAEKEPSVNKGGGKSQPISMNTPPVRGGGKSAPSTGKKAPVSKAKTGKTGKGGKAAAKKVIIKKVKSAVVKKLERDDPEGAAKLKAIAKKNPKQLEKIKNDPRRKKQAKELIAQIQQEKPEGGNQGFMAKVGSWMKKNPIKTSVAISLLSALGTIAATSIAGPAAGFAVGAGANAVRQASAFDVDGNKTRYDPTIATGTRVSSGEMSDF